LTISVLNH